jgi:hypothetical protein
MNHTPDMVQTAALSAHALQNSDADDVAGYIHSQRHPDGGFRGRSPASDLYYTVFGISCLIALRRPLCPEPIRRHLETFGDGADLDFAHLASLARCWALLSDSPAAGRGRQILRRMEAYRAADGGYNPLSRTSAQGSVYGSFLAFLTYAEVGAEMPPPENLLESIRPLRTADGGYANAAGVAAGTTPATSAAILLQRWTAGSPDPASVGALRACECRDGGFLAFRQAPQPDLLSTATALYALRAVDRGSTHAQAQAHLEFVETLWDEKGGFRGHIADAVSDCEYTFYALLALGCLHDG